MSSAISSPCRRRGVDETVEVVEGAEPRLDRGVAALFGSDRPRAAGVVGPRRQACCWAPCGSCGRSGWTGGRYSTSKPIAATYGSSAAASSNVALRCGSVRRSAGTSRTTRRTARARARRARRARDRSGSRLRSGVAAIHGQSSSERCGDRALQRRARGIGQLASRSAASSVADRLRPRRASREMSRCPRAAPTRRPVRRRPSSTARCRQVAKRSIQPSTVYS